MPQTNTSSPKSVRWTSPHEEALVVRAAKKKKVNLSAYLRESAVKQAEMDLADQTEYMFDDEQMDAFMVALDRPALIKHELQKLFNLPSILE